MKKNSGFTLLEMMVVCGIILILSAVAYIPISDRIEKNALLEVNSKIKTTFDNLSIKAYNYGKIYDVKMDFYKKEIIIYEEGVVVERVELPKTLEYEDVNGNKMLSRRTTPTGNMSKSFSIYITDKDKKDIYKRITIDTTSILKMIIIRSYKPTEKITPMNYREEKYEKLVWVKE